MLLSSQGNVRGRVSLSTERRGMSNYTQPVWKGKHETHFILFFCSPQTQINRMKATLSLILVLSTLAVVAFGGCTTTLYINDPLLSSLDFASGLPGNEFVKYLPYNRYTDLVVDYYVGNFTFAVQGGAKAAFVDLGTQADLISYYNIQLPWGNNVYYSIHVENTYVVFAQNYTAFSPFSSSQVAPLQNLVSYPLTVAPQIGHIYLINLFESPSAQYLVKLLVNDVKPGVSITIRWDVLSDNRSTGPKNFCNVNPSSN
eukprot:TRINITY_DN460_c0_g1_i1.p1 TRINITY_DN460_c0_g1~~TRINITY_DN460_c0_g1_i1.p1  ORF type:complete len:257 (+),score=38.27 TRINITY_DN460_c0_g1_i1:424-1194(+)